MVILARNSFKDLKAVIKEQKYTNNCQFWLTVVSSNDTTAIFSVFYFFFECSSEISEVISHQNSLFATSHFDFSWKWEWNVVILWAVCWYPQKFEIDQNFQLEIHVQKAISLNTWWISTNEDSKFKLDCVKSKNSYILIIKVIKFKLRFINFVYFFLRCPVWYFRYLCHNCLFRQNWHFNLSNNLQLLVVEFWRTDLQNVRQISFETESSMS